MEAEGPQIQQLLRAKQGTGLDRMRSLFPLACPLCLHLACSRALWDFW